jgi:hypothetical protein
MFEGETTITFAHEAAQAMLSNVLTKLFEMPIEVSSVSSDYRGLCVEFAPQGYRQAKEKQEEMAAREREAKEAEIAAREEAAAEL